MLKVTGLHLPPDAGEETLKNKICRQLRISPEELLECHLVKQSIDARDKGSLHFVCTVQVRLRDEEKVLSRCESKNVSRQEETPYTFPPVKRNSSCMPVIVGMGPAGLFSALFLARNRIPCVVLERGAPVEKRVADVETFWRTGRLDPQSNVQFGEGGAGTFSDGKLTTGTHDHRISAVLDTLIQAGAPEDVAWSFRPHVGTDLLRDVVKNIRKELESLGCKVLFHHRLSEVLPGENGVNTLVVRTPEGELRMETDALVLAIGHSARDTFEALYRAGLPMEQKPFAVGVRIEHIQAAVSAAQYGTLWDKLPPSDYRLSCHLPGGRSVFSFCVCPGGQVVASASEPGCLVTNGMSTRARDGENINGGLLVSVTPNDFPGDHPLAGVEFQRRWEREAFRLGGGEYRAPAQRTEDFLARRRSSAPGSVIPTYAPGVLWSDVSLCLPGDLSAALREAIPLLDRKVRGFAHPDSVLTGIETRSSSPVRILRGEDLQSPVRGIYPCGEGCGYAGGIVSAAVDGIRVAEAIAGKK